METHLPWQQVCLLVITLVSFDCYRSCRSAVASGELVQMQRSRASATGSKFEGELEVS
jgi:hypothetical protein